MIPSFRPPRGRRLLEGAVAAIRHSVIATAVAVVALPAVARAYTHPCLPLTASDISTLNANKSTAPWSAGYAKFSGSGEAHTKLNYTMRGPFVEVGRNPDVNLNAWREDMKAIFGLALQWKFTGDSAYADKARTILLAWANTNTVWSGVEPYLEMGDYMPYFGAGASILRSYSGWSAADTSTVKNYFANVIYPTTTVDIPLRSANQGAAHLVGAMGVAIYNDDADLFDRVVKAFRTDGCTGLLTTQSNGQIGDSGRDQGHAHGELFHYAWMAEVAWKAAGVDLFAEAGNRLRSAGEYYSNYNNGGSPAFLKSGTCYDLFSSMGGSRLPTVTPEFLHILQNAYVNRKGLAMPLLTAYRASQVDDWYTWVYLKTSDGSTASPLPGVVTTVPASVTNGLTKADINVTPVGSVSYSGGTWTVTGSGADLWGGAANDGCTFACKVITGDASIVAKVTSVQNIATNSKAGVMIRESLAANSKMAYVIMQPNGTVEGSGRGYDAVSHYANTQSDADAGLPYWLKIERRGNRVSCFHSPDGSVWTPIKTFDFTMGGACYLGLATSSHVNGTLAAATFTNVAIGAGVPNGLYKIKNRATGKYIDNLGSVANGDPVAQWSSSSSNNQKWTLATSGGYTRLACATGSKYLDSINHTGNSSTCAQWSSSPSTNQQWAVVDLGTGYYKIVNLANGYCLDSAGSTTNGTPLQFWTSGSSNNQQWSFELQ